MHAVTDRLWEVSDLVVLSRAEEAGFGQASILTRHNWRWHLCGICAPEPDAFGNRQPFKRTSHGFDSIYEAPLRRISNLKRKKCSQ
jgi:hypothetical protein